MLWNCSSDYWRRRTGHKSMYLAANVIVWSAWKYSEFWSRSLKSKWQAESELLIRPKTIIHQDMWLGELVPSPYKRSKLSNPLSSLTSHPSKRKFHTRWIVVSDIIFSFWRLTRRTTHCHDSLRFATACQIFPLACWDFGPLSSWITTVDILFYNLRNG